MLSAVTKLYGAAPQPPQLEAVPTAQDFIAALKALGLILSQAGKSDDSKQEDLHGTQQIAKGTMCRLQLLLRTLAAVCTYKQQVRSLLVAPARHDGLVWHAMQLIKDATLPCLFDLLAQPQDH